MNKQIIKKEIKELYDAGKIELSEEYNIIEDKNLRVFEIEHDAENEENISLVFKAKDWYEELLNEYYDGEIDYQEFIENNNANELDDMYDYDNVEAVINDEVRYDF